MFFTAMSRAGIGCAGVLLVSGAACGQWRVDTLQPDPEWTG